MTRRRFIGLWLAAVVAAAMAFIVHLAMRFENVRLGYEVDQAKREQRELIEVRRTLAIEAATLRQSERIETAARTVLHMDVPDPGRVVPMGHGPARGGNGHTAGRFR